MSDNVAWIGAFFGGLFVGIMTIVWLLVVFPQLHRKLTKFVHAICPCLDLPPERLSVTEMSVSDMQKTIDHSYSEIDERLPQTKSSSLKQKSANGCTSYEDYTVTPDKNRYSDLDAAKFKKKPVKQQTEVSKKAECNYFILEPGSDKRLPVKQVENKAQVLQNDPYHMYFILEPGTNKVTPLSASGKKLLAETPDPSYEPVYFVLEPMAGGKYTEAEPYAVNDLLTDHSYFILQKM